MERYTLRILLLFCLLLTCQTNPQMSMYLGRSYDMTKANPFSPHVDPGFIHPIFKFTYEKGLLSEDKRFEVPDRVHVQGRGSCSLQGTTKIHRGTKSYQDQLSVIAEMHGGGKLPGVTKLSFSLSSEFKKMN